MKGTIKHLVVMAGLCVIAMQYYVETAYAAQEGASKIKPLARKANTDRLGNFEIQDVKSPGGGEGGNEASKLGNFEIQLINSPRDAASGQATGQYK